jgi:hypothetical protein
MSRTTGCLTRAAVAAAVLAVAPLASAAGEAPPDVVVLPATGGVALPTPKDLAGAVEVLERATGAKAEQIVTDAGVKVPLAGGRAFAVDARTAEKILAGSHTSFRKAGLYLFRYERAYGIPGEKDRLAVVPTRDPDAVLRLMGTEGVAQGVTTEQIVAWLRAVNREEPLELLEIGSDFVSARFERAPKDPRALALRAVEFAPDLTGGHSDAIPGLTDLIGRHRTLFLIWR